MKVRRALKRDLNGINDLMDLYDQGFVSEGMLHDYAIVCEDRDKIIGFIWAMVSHGNDIAYVDFLAASPDYEGVGSELGLSMLAVLKKSGVKKIFSVVRDDKSDFSKKSVKINKKAGLEPHSDKYFFMIKDMEEKEDPKWVA